MKPGEREDAALTAAVLAGDERAFAELVFRHKEWLYRFIRRYVGGHDEAFDLLQETFVAAWTGLDAYNPDRPLPAWLRRIALNKCRDWSRRRAVRRFFFTAEAFEGRLEQSLPAPHDPQNEATEEKLRRLDGAIAALPPSLKEPLLLTVFEGLSQREAAIALGVTVKAIETRVRRAKAALAKRLATDP